MKRLIILLLILSFFIMGCSRAGLTEEQCKSIAFTQAKTFEDTGYMRGLNNCPDNCNMNSPMVKQFYAEKDCLLIIWGSDSPLNTMQMICKGNLYYDDIIMIKGK